MSASHPTQVPGDKVKKALTLFSELHEKHPEKSRQELLHEVEMKFDLSPLECDFLNKQFSSES